LKHWRKKSRLLAIAVSLALGIIIIVPGIALAINLPEVLQINAVWVYRNCMEDNDQLYLIDYTIDYDPDSNPLTDDNPDENITEAFLVRLMNGAVELGSTAPYAYYDEGYDRGVVALYFPAADPPGWGGTYTMILVGNPTLAWGTGPPETSVGTFDLWQDWPISTTQEILSSRILWLADQLELAWAVDMIETTASGSRLTEYGESYFVNVIPDLRTMAPSAFVGQIIQPEVEKREFTGDYSGDLAASVIDTPLDLTPLADAFDLSREVVTTVLYYAAVVIFLALLVTKIRNYKPAILMTVPCIIGGAFLGVPLVITVLAGFFSLILIAYILFYQKSTA